MTSTAGGHQRTRRQGRGVRGQVALQNAGIVVVGNEADLHRFRLVRRGETQPARVAARLRLREHADRREHSRHHLAVDSPQEVALVLVPVPAPVEGAVAGYRVVPGGDVVAVQRVGMGQQVAELGERVAANAGDRGPAAAVLAHEILDDVQVEPVLEIEHVMRDTQRVGDVARVIDRVERAAGTVGHRVAVAEQLHGGADHLVALLDQTGGGHRAVHAARHGHQHALSHGRASRRASVPWRPRRASPPPTRSTSASLLPCPRLNRTAPRARSLGTPMAISTCEGSTAPVEQADPPEAATPARSRCMSRASLSAPGTATLSTCGARSPPRRSRTDRPRRP